VEEVAAEGDSALVCASSSQKPQTIFNEEENQACVVGVEGSLPMQRASGDIVEAHESILGGITAEGHTASVCASSSEETQTLVNAEEGEACANGADGRLHMRQASDDIVEANESILEGDVAEGDTALVCASSSKKLQTLLNTEEGQACGNGTDGSLPMRRACDDIEANELILEGVTAEGDTALHVVAACGQGDNFFTRFREAKHLLVEQNNKKKQRLTRTELHELTTYGDGDNFLESARIIYGKAKHLLFVQNNKGDTPLHCAARAGKSNMVACLIDLASAEGEDRIKELLRKGNKHKETALHEAVRVGNNDIVDLLMGKDSELASFSEDGGASPMYQAIMLKHDEIVKTLYDKTSRGKLSFSRPNGQNALHAAVLRHQARGTLHMHLSFSPTYKLGSLTSPLF
jgi:ankyrin repeat protein